MLCEVVTTAINIRSAKCYKRSLAEFEANDNSEPFQGLRYGYSHWHFRPNPDFRLTFKMLRRSASNLSFAAFANSIATKCHTLPTGCGAMIVDAVRVNSIWLPETVQAGGIRFPSRRPVLATRHRQPFRPSEPRKRRAQYLPAHAAPS